MTPEQQERLKVCLQEAASILYAETEQEMQNLEDIERVVRDHLLNQVGPEIGHFLSSRSRRRHGVGFGASKAASET